jgi:hypothetical protein
MATQSSISTYIQSKAAGLDTTKLSTTVSWTNTNEMPLNVNSSGSVVRNNVTVTVTYQWVPVAYLATMNLTSTSVMSMQY